MRWIGLGLAGVATALVAAAIAGAQEPADPSFAMSVSPSRVSMPGRTRLVYRLRIQTGAEAERFAVDLAAPLFRTRLGSIDHVHREGATITPDTEITLEGPGKLTRIGEGSALIGCSPSNGLAAHGYEPRYPGLVLELPARSVSTLVARYRTGDVDLWPGADLRLTVRASRANAAYGASTLARPVEIRSPKVTVSGRTATRIELWTNPQSSPGVFKRLRRLEADTALEVAGRAMPARAGRRVSLWILRHGEGERARRLATVATDARGRLRFRTRTPSASGSYELWARTANDAGGPPEHSCSMAFEVPSAG